MNYQELFDTLNPGFFERESIRSMPCEYVFEEQVLDLHTFSPADVLPDCPLHITFGFYRGDMEPLHVEIGRVNDGWVQYFQPGNEIYCAFDGDRIVSFCRIDDRGSHL